MKVRVGVRALDKSVLEALGDRVGAPLLGLDGGALLARLVCLGVRQDVLRRFRIT